MKSSDENDTVLMALSSALTAGTDALTKCVTIVSHETTAEELINVIDVLKVTVTNGLGILSATRERQSEVSDKAAAACEHLIALVTTCQDLLTQLTDGVDIKSLRAASDRACRPGI